MNWITAVSEVGLDENSTFNREETEAYIRAKDFRNQVSPNPRVEYLNEIIFPLLKEGIVDMFIKVKKDKSFQKSTSTFNGLDYLSEFLYNKNPNYPDRELNWTYIFDIPWVEACLKEKPRPYYAFHLVWSHNFAALKIQSFMRGHWIRCRPAVQELRQFWKLLKDDRKFRLSEDVSELNMM